ncbi:MAG: tetratricopeptide repeat protein [Acidobacteriota bacterium]
MQLHRILRSPLLLVGISVLMGLAILAAPPASADMKKAQKHLAKGVEELQKGNAEKGLREFEKAIKEEPKLAVAHFYAGMASGQLRKYAQAFEHFVDAAELSPGYGEAHKQATITAFYQGKYEDSWEQAILASQAGIDMAQAFTELRGKADPPADFEQRLQAPRVLIGDVDIEALTGRDSSLISGRQAVRGAEDIKADERGGGVGGDPVTGAAGAASDPFSGADRIARPRAQFGLPSGASLAGQLQGELSGVARQFGMALLRSPGFGVVPKAELATYVLRIKVDDVGEDEPRLLVGFVKLLDPESGAELYSRPLELRNISSVSDLRNDIDRYVGYMEQWLRAQERSK